MGDETLRYEEKGGVTVVTLLRAAEDLGGMAQLSAEMSECCRRFGENGEARVLVITGERADAFSMEEAMRDRGEGRAEFISLAEPIAAVERPVLAGIPGDAIGPGLELALACDVRIAAEGARFALPHVRAGVMPWDGGTQRLLRTVGKGKTLEMVLTGEPVDAREANRIGLVSRLVPAADVITTVMKMAQEMAAKSPVSLEYCKEAINKGMELTLSQGLRLEADLYFLMHTTGDREEGIKAFKEKRQPEFQGI